jgi:GT2 family glycosyltransferase
MISIIICTTDPVRINPIKKNISETIGVEHELVVIDNSRSEYSIHQAYNLGISISKFPILCFMHDDIVYHSKNWGVEVVKHFNSEYTGMIGIGGTRYLGNIPTIWWAGGKRYSKSGKGTICINCIETSRKKLQESKHTFINPENTEKTKVIILDGLWFCMSKRLFEKISFDENNYKGFHFYDLDISMQVNKLGYNIYCIFDIMIEHIADSKHDVDWIENCFAFYRKWKSSLPLTYVKLSFTQLIISDIYALKFILKVYLNNIFHINIFKFFHSISFRRLIGYHIKTLMKINHLRNIFLI